jgi:hypothetical protein
LTLALPRRCGECDAVLAERQRWCVACGGAPRIALAPAPTRRARAAAAAAVAALALVGLGVALAALFS